MFFRSAGDPSAPAFVLLHGFPSSSHMYRELIPRIAERFHVIAPDFLGFGYSDAPPVEAFEYSFDTLAGLVAQLLEQLGVERYYLYMQDYGGPIGMRLATAHPERIHGLVFQNANCYLDGIGKAAADVFLPLWETGDESGARQLLLAETTRFQYAAGARNPAGLNPDAWTHDQAALDRPGNAEIQLALFRNYQTNVALYPGWQEYFRRHQPKTLLAWGKGDPFFIGAGAEAFRRDLLNLEIHYFDTGHFALEEDVAPIASLIKSYF
jgi:pimeloyl-ACP methyl ester carboxylesterase